MGKKIFSEETKRILGVVVESGWGENRIFPACFPVSVAGSQVKPTAHIHKKRAYANKKQLL
jgi:transcription initiation factor IIF auxiliary subunit